jgi:hypothetical protein
MTSKKRRLARLLALLYIYVLVLGLVVVMSATSGVPPSSYLYVSSYCYICVLIFFF